MNAPRKLVALAAGVLLAAGVGEAQAQTIVARVGDVAGRQNEYVDVPITVDMRGAPGLRLGSYRAALRWDPAVLQMGEGFPGSFALPRGRDDSSGAVRFAAIQPSGADGLVTLVVIRFRVLDETRSTSIVLTFDEMSAAGTFENLLPYLTVQSGSYCRALGIWGDVDGDGLANSRDALIALSKVVGIALDTLHVDTLAGPIYDTTVTMRPSLADVDADGAVTSRDALIIMTHAVGLPIGDFRIGQRAAGSCTALGTVTLTVSPDTLELQSLQYAPVVVTAHDAAGRAVSLTGVVWRSSNTAVAAYFIATGGGMENGFSAVVGRDPGTAILTAELTPNVRASLVVKVVARRVHWYVDAVRATNVPTQTGSPRHPMAFIGDALDYAYDGDTIHVAPGIYEEIVSAGVSVAILGDPANRPVIDARSYPDYDAWSTKAVQLGSLPGQVTLENLRIVGGGVLVGAHDLVVRNVRIDAPGAQDVFIFAGPMSSGPSGAPAGLRLAPADVPVERAGKALIDGLYVAGYQETGIVVAWVDSAIVRNSSAVRDSIGTAPDCYSTSLQYAGIGAFYIGSSTELRDNTVTNAPCSAIRLIQSSGRAVISHNRVLGARAGGIVVAADTVELDHNLVRDVPSYSEYPAVGIGVGMDSVVMRVTSLGDSVINVGQRGFAVDTALVGIIDSLFVDGTAQDHVSNRPGVDLRGGHFTIRNSHISNTWGGNAISVCGWNATLTSRGNRITNPGFNGISAWDCTDYSNGPDSLISVSDTVIGPFAYEATGIRAADAVFASVDGVVVTGTATDTAMGVGFVGVGHAVLRDSKVSGFGNEAGVYAEDGGSALLERDSVIGAAWGLWFSGNSDTSRVHRTVVKDSRFTGIWTESGAVLRADSTKVYGSMINAMMFDYNGGGRVTDSWLEDNGYAVTVGASNGTAGLVFRKNTFANNDSGSVRNLSSATVDAQQNWWGTTDVPASAGMSGLVDFADFLTSVPTLLLAPPAWSAVARVASAERASQAALPPLRRDSSRGHGSSMAGNRQRAGATISPPPVAPAASALTRSREHMAHPPQSWQRGRTPRPARVRPPT